MKALFLGHFAAGVAPRILAKVKTPLESSILDDEGDAAHLAPLLAESEIVVGHIWRPSFPPAPRLRLLQSVAAGLDLLDTRAVPKGVRICNVFGHEPAIAEYVIMTMLVLTHGLFEPVTAFRAGSWVASPQFGGGSPHGEVLGRTIGIIGYGRIGREVAERAAGLKCCVLAANRSPVSDPAPPKPFSVGRSRSHAPVMLYGPYLVRAGAGDERGLNRLEMLMMLPRKPVEGQRLIDVFFDPAGEL